MLASTRDYLTLPIVTTIDYSAFDVDVSLSRSSTDPSGVWWPGEPVEGGVQLLIGPGSPVGQLASGTWWAHVRIGGPSPRLPVFCAGPFVIQGGDAPVPPADGGDYDGGEVA